ncbi:MAG TPA: galactokinase [Thermoanaerobaculia bacterium]|nr:galactokinase [Thermoanaerobaculia bacterium]
MTAAEVFGRIYGAAPHVGAEAPGRVNVIGEHTDYSGGFVLPAAIPLRCSAALTVRRGATVRVFSERRADDGILTYELGREEAGRGWIDYVQGLTRTLADRGVRLEGFDLAIASEIPPGSGLASSAALEIAVLRALRESFGLGLDDVSLAQIARRAENDFVGAPVGVMDPMAASLAPQGAALFLDTRSLAYERVPIPPDAELAVIDSGIPHEHSRGGYRVRRAECDEAARRSGVEALRDLFGRDPDEAVRVLPEPLGRRVRHVLGENARVLETIEAFRAGDLPRAGALLRASQRSLAEDFEVSTPELDLLAELATRRNDVFGARLTGGGFGGSVIALVRRGKGGAAAEAVAAEYGRRSGRAATVLLPLSTAAQDPRS